ncbi:hypothetical protein ACFL14_00885 [Patescibacteria group bacterium]
METSTVTDIVAKAKSGDQLRLVFKNGTGQKGTLDDATQIAVVYLAMGAQEGMLILAESDWATMYAVGTSGFWDNNSNRTVMATVPDEFDKGWFIDRLSPGLESVEIA